MGRVIAQRRSHVHDGHASYLALHEVGIDDLVSRHNTTPFKTRIEHDGVTAGKPAAARQHTAAGSIAFSTLYGSRALSFNGDEAVTLPPPLFLQTGSFIPPLDRSMAVFILMNSCSYVERLRHE